MNKSRQPNDEPTTESGRYREQFLATVSDLKSEKESHLKTVCKLEDALTENRRLISKVMVLEMKLLNAQKVAELARFDLEVERYSAFETNLASKGKRSRSSSIGPGEQPTHKCDRTDEEDEDEQGGTLMPLKRRSEPDLGAFDKRDGPRSFARKLFRFK